MSRVSRVRDLFRESPRKDEFWTLATYDSDLPARIRLYKYRRTADGLPGGAVLHSIEGVTRPSEFHKHSAQKNVSRYRSAPDSANTSDDSMHPQPTYSRSSTPTAPAPAPFRRSGDLYVGSAAKRTETYRNFAPFRARRPETSRALVTAPAVHSHTPPAVACAASAYISKG